MWSLFSLIFLNVIVVLLLLIIIFIIISSSMIACRGSEIGLKTSSEPWKGPVSVSFGVYPAIVIATLCQWLKAIYWQDASLFYYCRENGTVKNPDLFFDSISEIVFSRGKTHSKLTNMRTGKNQIVMHTRRCSCFHDVVSRYLKMTTAESTKPIQSKFPA